MKDYEFRMRVAKAITRMKDRDPFFEDHTEHELALRLEKELKIMRKMVDNRKTVCRSCKVSIC